MVLRSITRIVLPLFTLLAATLVFGCGTSAPPQQANTAAPSQPSPAASQAASTGTQTKLDLNTGSESDFMTIPGMTKRMVHEFEEYRPYQSIQQFRKEMGKYVSPAVIADYEKYVYVPISLNDSDAATLQQIPGLDAAEAAGLIAARPFASKEAFLAKLADKITPAELDVAKTYIR